MEHLDFHPEVTKSLGQPRPRSPAVVRSVPLRLPRSLVASEADDQPGTVLELPRYLQQLQRVGHHLVGLRALRVALMRVDLGQNRVVIGNAVDLDVTLLRLQDLPRL